MSSQPIIVKSEALPPLQVLGTQVRFLCEAHNTNSAWSLMQVTLPVGSGPPPHSHDWDEAYFVTAGDVDFVVGTRRYTASAGDFLYTPAGVVHGFRGASAQPACVLIFDAPAHAGAFFKRVDREVRELPRDLPKVFDIGEATGIHFVRAA